jgi:hypothetical protein
MTENSTAEPHDDTERLKADLADRERELEELKKDNARTKKVGNALWTHEIYLNARKKLAVGVFVVLGALSAVGAATVSQLYQTGLDFVNGELKESIGARIKLEADTMVEGARKDMDRQISDHIEVLIAEKKVEIEAQIEATQRDVEAKLAASASQATETMSALVEEKEAEIGVQIAAIIAAKKAEIGAQLAATQREVDAKLSSSTSQATERMTALVEAAEREIRVKIEELEQTIQDEGDALSKRVKEIRIAMTAPAEATRAEGPLPVAAADCDPNNLNSDQIVRVGVRQLSVGTGNRSGREVFKNTLFLDVRGAASTAKALAEAGCILDGVDRVVYGADPKWYRPSEFVRIDRENEFRFTISGWGPTVLTAKLYFIGRRESVLVKGHLALGTAAGGGKRYLDDVPLDNFQ